MNQIPSIIRPLLVVWMENDLSTLAKTAKKMFQASKEMFQANVDFPGN